MELYIYVRNCPVCEQGLCRVRLCGVAAKEIYPLFVCDECETTWTDVELTQTHREPETSEGVSTLWDSENRWATVEDVSLLGIFSKVQIERTDSHDT